VERLVALPALRGQGFDRQVATALLRARHLSGLDREQFARALSVTPDRLAIWEAGEGSLPATALLQAASVAGVSVDVLFGRRSLIRRMGELEHQVQDLTAALDDPRVLSRRLHALLDDWSGEDQRYDDAEVKRREFLALMLLTLGANARVLDLDRLVDMVTSGRVDKAGLDDLRTMTRGYAARAETMPPLELLQTARTHLTVLTGLLANVNSPAMRRGLARAVTALRPRWGLRPQTPNLAIFQTEQCFTSLGLILFNFVSIVDLKLVLNRGHVSSSRPFASSSCCYPVRAIGNRPSDCFQGMMRKLQLWVEAERG
jgi:transcriptional regulator with XRE-family HTH domain